MTIMKKPVIKIHASLFIFLILAAFTGFLTSFLCLFSILIFHECGHLLFIKLFKGKIKQIHLTLIGGIMDIETPHLSFFQNLCILCGRPDSKFNSPWY